MKKKNNNLKWCPFIDERCKAAECMVYHEQFERCGVDLLSWNLFALKETINNLNLNEK